MGPTRQAGESESSFRFRYARYSGMWLVFLGAPLLLLLAIRPSTEQEGATLFLLFFLYIGLGVGTGMSLLAGIGYFIGGAWSTLLESSQGLSRSWFRLKLYLQVLVTISVMVFAAYWLYRGVIDGATLAVSRKTLLIDSKNAPGLFVFSMIFWLLIASGTAYHSYSIIRKARNV